MVDFEESKEHMIQIGIDLLNILQEDTKIFNMIGDLLHELDFNC